MNKLSNSLDEMANKYFSLSGEEKEAFLRRAYLDEEMSWPQIAELVGTYTNRVRRDATKFNISTRDRSSAQKNALANERVKHPVEGRKRTTEERLKMSKRMTKNWDELSKKEKERRGARSKKMWDAKSEEEKANFREKSIQAIRATSVNGSRLEKFFLKKLIENGYKVQFHKEHFVKNNRLQVDLLLPELAIAIEVDGPSHREPVWGEEAFTRTVRADRQKTGLIIGMGFTLIRVQQVKRISLAYMEELLEKLVKAIEDIREGRDNIVGKHVII